MNFVLAHRALIASPLGSICGVTLGHLKLDFCIILKVVEKISGNLKELHLSYTSVAELPASIWSLHDLVYLNLSGCESLKSVPNDIQKLMSLKRLDLSGCSSLDKLSNEIGCLSQLEKISLDGNNIMEIPVSIKNLSKLNELSICICKRLQSLPELPLSLELLDASGCISLQTISNSRGAGIQGLRSDNHVMICRKFFYADCLKLDQNKRNNIVSEFQLRTLDSSINSVPSHGILKIPIWFTDRSESSSIKVELSSNWHNTNFLGFALCAVVAGDTSHLNLSCEANFKTNNAKSCEVHWEFNNFDTNYDRFKTHNLFMWYKHENFHDYLDALEVSFRFKAKYSGEDKVRACGIRLLCRQDAEELGITIKFGKSNVTSSTGAVNFDTGEPLAKRVKSFNS
ncbi:hypothetical protein TIFTF001_038057 [Ficus carica]|uniref:Uncharacterized protein n=1 Tax=Ficus carica TaxID=3494 RepID=A0AA88JCQ5_FICCA|nr:hypothetical protein TIFTF001_038052 [Ficus carica]GMN69006.1 hypothetical protein TIFTF001_038057 [Ficus carica]